jgi:hypothetical protein
MYRTMKQSRVRMPAGQPALERCNRGRRLPRHAGRTLLPLAALAAILAGMLSGPVLSAAESPMSISMTLAGDSLRSGESIGFSAWLANGGDDPLAVELQFTAPGSVRLGRMEDRPPPAGRHCKPWSLPVAPPPPTTGRPLPAPPAEAPRGLPVATIPPHQVRQLDGCLLAGGTVAEGKLNVAFTFLAAARAGKEMRMYTSTIEKPITLGLLGTEDVGGFSLRLITLVLPGLVLLGLLRIRWFLMSAVSDLNAAEHSALAVLISAALVYLAARFFPPTEAGGVDLTRLAGLCAASALLAVGLGSGWRFIEEAWSARLVQPEDDGIAALRKALPRRWPWPRLPWPDNVQVRHEDKEYRGSLRARTPDGHALLGWFQLRVPATHPRRDELRDDLDTLMTLGKWRALLARARKEGLKVEVRNRVRVRAQAADWAYHDSEILRSQATNHERIAHGDPAYSGRPLEVVD